MSSKAQVFQTLLSGLRFSGITLSSGKVYFYEPGTDDLRAVYADRNKNTEAANPFTLDSDGRGEVYGDGTYDILVTDSNDVTKAEWEDVALQDVFTGSEQSSTNYASLNAAITAIGATPTTLKISTADFPMTGNATVPATLTLEFTYPGSIDQGAYNLTINSPFSPGRYQIFTGNGVVSGLKEARPEWWGAVGDGVTDDTVAIQKFFDVLTANSAKATMHGTFLISDELTFTGGGGSTIDFDAEIITNEALDWILKFVDHSGIVFTGSLTVTGAGTNDYASRTCIDGIVFENCRGSKFEKLRAENFLRYGIYVTATGNNSLLDLGDVRTFYCGSSISADHQSSHSYSGKTNTGSASSFSQRSVVTLTSVPANLATFMLAKVDSEPYIVTAISGNNVTVYPWIKSTSATGTIDFYIGAGVNIAGDDAASVNFNSVDSTYSAVGVRSSSLYGFKGKRLITQYNGVGLAVGNNTSSGYFGNTLESYYTEGNDFDLVKTTSGTVGLTINGLYEFDPSKYYKLSPRLASYEYDGLYSTINSVLINSDGNTYLKKQLANGLGGYSASYTVTADNSVIPIKGGNTVSIALTLDPNKERIFGHNHMTFIVYGRRTGSRVDTITFTPSNGAHTVMGGASYVVSGVASVMMATAWFDYEASNWVITATPLHPATTPLTGSGPPGFTPSYIGQEYLDIPGSKWYKAKGVASSADWLILN